MARATLHGGRRSLAQPPPERGGGGEQAEGRDEQAGERRRPERRPAEGHHAAEAEAEVPAEGVLRPTGPPRARPEPHGARRKADPHEEAPEEQAALAEAALEDLDHPARHQPEVGRPLVDRRVGDRASEEVEEARGEALPERDLRRVLPDGVHDVVPLLVGGQERGDERRRVLQVAVHHDHGVRVAVVEPGQERRLLAEVRGEGQDADRSIGRRDVPQQRQRAIGAAVDHVERRGGPALERGEDAAQLLVEGEDDGLLVSDRADDGECSHGGPGCRG